MKTFLFGLSLSLILFSCKKEDLPPSASNTSKKDYSTFLAQTNQTFQGRFNDDYFNWNFGIGTFQGIKGYQNANGLCDSTPLKVALFGLTSSYDSGQTRFWLNTPPYNINTITSTDVANMFSLGLKKLGQFGKNFSLTILQNKILYQTFDSAPNSEIEILKTQEFIDDSGIKNLRVWFRIDAKLNNINDEIKLTNLNDGLMIANFWGLYKTN